MVGVRVLIGSQSIERAPSYLEVFGRTTQVYIYIIAFCLLPLSLLTFIFPFDKAGYREMYYSLFHSCISILSVQLYYYSKLCMYTHCNDMVYC